MAKAPEAKKPDATKSPAPQTTKVDPKLAKNASDPKLAKNASDPKLAKAPSDPILAKVPSNKALEPKKLEKVPSGQKLP